MATEKFLPTNIVEIDAALLAPLQPVGILKSDGTIITTAYQLQNIHELLMPQVLHTCQDGTK